MIFNQITRKWGMTHKPPSQELQIVSQEDLDEIIKKHARFDKCLAGGARANVKFKSLVGLRFHGANLSGADFTGSDLRNCDFSNGIFLGSVFYGCNLQHSNFEHADLRRADFRGADVTSANMNGANLEGADLRQGSKVITQSGRGAGTVLSEGKTTLAGADLENANLTKARAAALDLSHADLSHARMVQADLSHANLSNADLQNANLTKANLAGAELEGADFTNATTTDMKINDDTQIPAPPPLIMKYEDPIDPLVEILKAHAQWLQHTGTKGQQAKFEGVDFRHIHDLGRYSLTMLRAQNCNFESMTLLNAQMQSSHFDGSNFGRVVLKQTDARGSSFVGAKFVHADLREVNFSPLYFSTSKRKCVDLSGADLSYADLSRANLDSAILDGTILIGAKLDHVNLKKLDLSKAILGEPPAE